MEAQNQEERKANKNTGEIQSLESTAMTVIKQRQITNQIHINP